MKKYIFLVVILLGFLIYFVVSNKVNKIDVIRVGTECDYAPNNWEEKRDTNSNVPLANNEGCYAEGYDIQIAKIVADEIGAKLVVKKIAWQDLIPALQGREIDAIFSGMLDTSERRRTIAFSDVYAVEETEYTIIINKNGKYSHAKKCSDFKGAKVTAQKGTNLYNAIDQIPGALPLAAVDTVQEWLDKLVKGEIDASIINLDTGRSYERIYPELSVIRFPEGEGFHFDYKGICAGVRKKDTKLLTAINDALRNLSKHDRQKIMDRTIAREWENISLIKK